jgi:hypothetical protein
MLDLYKIDIDLGIYTNDLFFLRKDRKIAELDTKKRIAFAVC